MNFEELIIEYEYHGTTFETTLGEQLSVAASANKFHMGIDYNSKTKYESSNQYNKHKIHRLFSKQQILGIRVIIVQRKISLDLTRTCS